MLIDAQLNDFEDFGPVKPGTYEFIIKEPVEVIPVVDEQTDIGGKCYNFIIRPELVGGEQAGKKVRRQFSNKSKATRYFLRSFLEKVGVNIQEGGRFTSEDLLGRKFRAAVGERMGTGENTGKKYADLDTESIVAL
jgi:hypothetical protein